MCGVQFYIVVKHWHWTKRWNHSKSFGNVALTKNGHTLKHNEELHSIILEGIIEGKHKRGRPRTCNKSQVMKDARFDWCKQLKDKVPDRESWREHWLKTNLKFDKKKIYEYLYNL